MTNRDLPHPAQYCNIAKAFAFAMTVDLFYGIKIVTSQDAKRK